MEKQLVLKLAREAGFKTGAYFSQDAAREINVERSFVESVARDCSVELSRFADLVLAHYAERSARSDKPAGGYQPLPRVDASNVLPPPKHP